MTLTETVKLSPGIMLGSVMFPEERSGLHMLMAGPEGFGGGTILAAVSDVEPRSWGAENALGMLPVRTMIERMVPRETVSLQFVKIILLQDYSCQRYKAWWK